MIMDVLYTGFDKDFLTTDNAVHQICLPSLKQEKIKDIAVTEKFVDGIIPYLNFSLLLSKERKFAYYTATNIDGSQFQKVPRKDSWKLDPRLKGLQWGYELYSAQNAGFDRGHLTKREDVQWGLTIGLAFKAAESTFYYSNSVPQHKELNRDVWRSLEDYILHAETTKNSFRVSVFTGPVLSENDPHFITEVNGVSVKLPVLFWKIVYFVKQDQSLYRVGFLMSQLRLLQTDQIIEELESDFSDDRFLQFKEACTYQVNISLIESLTGLIFYEAIDSFTDVRPSTLIFKEIDLNPDLESKSLEQHLGFEITNIKL